MKRSKVSYHQIINMLNKALEMDRTAISNVFNHRTLCNRNLAYHPSIQTLGKKLGKEEIFKVGPLGIINGLFGTFFNYGPIAMVIDPETKIISRFKVTKEWLPKKKRRKQHE